MVRIEEISALVMAGARYAYYLKVFDDGELAADGSFDQWLGDIDEYRDIGDVAGEFLLEHCDEALRNHADGGCLLAVDVRQSIEVARQAFHARRRLSGEASKSLFLEWLKGPNPPTSEEWDDIDAMFAEVGERRAAAANRLHA